uniref:F-box domain-containing protein n=1 Tax=Caenorhabditis tropicalis TaxID=1561998 RepID=A0A1I7UTJ9_9PELO
MDLLRFPLVVLIEVFKYLDFKEKFLISLLSKKARNKLKLTSVSSDSLFNLSNKLFIRLGYYTEEHRLSVTKEKDYFIGKEVMKLGFHSKGVLLEEESFQKQLLLANHLLDTFRISAISVSFPYVTEPADVLEFFKMIKQRQLSIKSFYCRLDEVSSEFISKILDECTEVTDRVVTTVWFPDGFVYTPTRPFNATKLLVYGNSNWSNLESFMNCRYATVQLGKNSTRTAQFYNSFFTKWMDSGARLQRLTLRCMKEGIQHEIGDKWIEISRKNGIQFFVESATNYISIYTKQGYMEHLKEIEQRELAR